MRILDSICRWCNEIGLAGDRSVASLDEHKLLPCNSSAGTSKIVQQAMDAGYQNGALKITVYRRVIREFNDVLFRAEKFLAR